MAYPYFSSEAFGEWTDIIKIIKSIRDPQDNDKLTTMTYSIKCLFVPMSPADIRNYAEGYRDNKLMTLSIFLKENANIDILLLRDELLIDGVKYKVLQYNIDNKANLGTYWLGEINK